MEGAIFSILLTFFVIWCIYKFTVFVLHLTDVYLIPKNKTQEIPHTNRHQVDYEALKKYINPPVSDDRIPVKETDIDTIPFGNFQSIKEERNPDVAPFIRKKSLLTISEKKFYQELRKAWKDEFDIYSQVGLGAIFEPISRIKNWGSLSRLNKRIDFLILDKVEQTPLLAIEYDDSSHGESNRRPRDKFVEDLFRSNGIPFVRYCYGNHSAEELYKELSSTLKRGTATLNYK